VTRPSKLPSAQFRREWNAAFLLVTIAALLLVAGGHTIAGAAAVALGAIAFVARRSAMRKQGLGFYGQDKQSG
jgi:hypothetical protein